MINAIEFLERVVKRDPTLDPGNNVVVVGAGNTAMDAARAAKAFSANVYIVYRRDRRNMPADEEELVLALKDGVEFKELLTPFAFSDGKLFCKKNVLGDFDASGRQTPVETDDIAVIPADTVIAAVGEKTDKDLYEALEIEINEKGFPIVDENNQTGTDSVYVAGDGLKGPATIVEAIHDATVAVNDIIRRSGVRTDNNPILAEARSLILETHSKADTEALKAKKGILITDCTTNDTFGDCSTPAKTAGDGSYPSLTPGMNTCLGCDRICENCVDVCPNRANMEIVVPGLDMPQILHIDDMCNECGNCTVFCPYSGNPYRDKFTLFSDLRSFTDSTNEGFILLDKENLTFRVRFGTDITDEEPFSDYCSLNDTVKEFIKSVYTGYPYLFK